MKYPSLERLTSFSISLGTAIRPIFSLIWYFLMNSHASKFGKSLKNANDKKHIVSVIIKNLNDYVLLKSYSNLFLSHQGRQRP